MASDASSLSSLKLYPPAPRFSNLITVFRCMPVVATNSFSIAVFAFLAAQKYPPPPTAAAYSTMLRRVTLPPFSNTKSDATIPLSVTMIMTQLATLTNMAACATKCSEVLALR